MQEWFTDRENGLPVKVWVEDFDEPWILRILDARSNWVVGEDLEENDGTQVIIAYKYIYIARDHWADNETNWADNETNND